MPNGMYGGVRGEDKTSPTRLLLGKFSKLPYNTKNAPRGSHCGRRGLCRSCDLPQAKNPDTQDSLFKLLVWRVIFMKSYNNGESSMSGFSVCEIIAILKIQIRPSDIIASATFLNPAILAPATKSYPNPYSSAAAADMSWIFFMICFSFASTSSSVQEYLIEF